MAKSRKEQASATEITTEHSEPSPAQPVADTYLPHARISGPPGMPLIPVQGQATATTRHRRRESPL